MTFAEEIETEADGPILACVVGEMGWGNSDADPILRKDEVLTWEEARPFLDYEYDDGYGAPECHAIYAWTETRVIFVVQYDGSTTLESVPRNPTGERPAMSGG